MVTSKSRPSTAERLASKIRTFCGFFQQAPWTWRSSTLNTSPEMSRKWQLPMFRVLSRKLTNNSKPFPRFRKYTNPVFERWGIKTLGAIQVPERVVHVFCKEPVNTLEELKTKKVRVWGRHQVETFSKLGVSASIIPQSEMYVALQTGVVDCATYMGSVATTVSLQEVAPYGAPLHPHAGVPINILITQERFDGLSEANQAALEAAATDTLDYTNEEFLSGEREEAGIKLLIDQGGQIIEPFSEADQTAFTAAAREAWESMSSEIGPKAIENMASIQKAIAEE